MTNDPIIEEVRKIRHEIEREFQHDPENFYKRLKASQEKLGVQLVCRHPKILVTSKQKKVG